MKIKFNLQDHTDLKDWCGLRIWTQPQELRQYTIGADVAEGVGGDASVAQVLDCKTGRHVASFWSNAIDTDNYAAELYKLGQYYNRAEICVESNNHGNGVIALMGGSVGGLAYSNLYRRIEYDEFTQKRTKLIGFKTSNQTKPRIIENLKNALRDGEVVTYDEQTIQELGNYMRDSKSGKTHAKGSGHDDRVMALALAWESARIIRENATYSDNQYIPVAQYDPSTGFPIF